MAKQPIVVTLSVLIVLSLLACFFVLHHVDHVVEKSVSPQSNRGEGLVIDLNRFREDITRAETVSGVYQSMRTRQDEEKKERISDQ